MKSLFTIFASPEKTFQRVKSSSHISWLLPMIVLMILTAVSTYLLMPITENIIKSNPNVTPEMYEATRTLTMINAYISVLLQPAIMIFLGGLLFMLLNLIVRGEGKYMQLVTLVAYAALPGAIGSLLMGILAMATDAQTLTDVTISLGALVQDKEGILYRVLSIINPFTIWTLILYVIGASVMMDRSKKQVGIWIVVVWTIYSIGISLLFKF